MSVALASTRGMDRSEWLRLRRHGIGGSDAAAIAGLSRWKSPVAVYLDKIGAIEEEEPGESAYWGTVLEDVVAKEFTTRTGLKVRRRNAILKSPEHTFMLANVDRLIIGEHAGLECKTASEYLKGDWEDGRVPDYYALQCHHYMAVTGMKAWYIAALIGGNKFIWQRIDRDEEIIQYLVQIERDFWRLVENRTPPAIDGSQASSEVIDLLYRKSSPGTRIHLPPDAEILIERYQQAAADEKAAAERKDAAANQLKQLLGENEEGIIGERRVSWKSVTSTRLDSKALKANHPDIYAQYARESVSRRFLVK